MFLFQSNSHADQALCPPLPDGFPDGMMVKHRWLKRGMHPRDVDRLTRQELFWLPVIEAAEAETIRQLTPSD